MSKKYLFADIETHSAQKRWGMTPQEFFRLGQYAWGNGEVVLTTDYDEIIAAIRDADYVIFHNGHAFDLSVLFGTDSLEPLHMAQQRKIIDTMTLATLLMPAPMYYTHWTGSRARADSPAEVARYYGLENLSFQAKLPGKFGSLQDLAKKYNPPGTKKDDLDYGLIPLDDPDFLEYARRDVTAVRDLFYYLRSVQKQKQINSEYLWREQEVYAILAQITRNGIRPNVELATSRSQKQAKLAADTMKVLQEEYGLPTTGKAPWKSNAGKEAILNALAGFGITPEHEDWEKTAKGAPSFGGDVMKAVTKGTDAESFGESLAQLQGLRSMPDLVLASITEDGRMHPDYSAFQKSGRFSVSRPSILIFNKVHKDLLLADEGCLTVEGDFSSADARAVAALSGDEEFARRFEEDADGNPLHDGHNLTGEALFGYVLYHLSCEDKSKCGKDCRPDLRDASKAAGLSLGYNVGPVKLATILNKAAKELGLDIRFWASEQTYWKYRKAEELKGREPLTEEAWLDSLDREGEIHTRKLIFNYHNEYAGVKWWKDKVVREGDEQGYVENSWGRRMPIDFAGAGWDAEEGERSRSYNQSPALYGQSTTREMMADGLIRLMRHSDYMARSVRGIIHDACIFDFKEGTIKQDIKVAKELMSATFNPETRYGMEIDFHMEFGKGGHDWISGAH